MLGIGQLERVSYGVVCGISYYVDTEKASISENDCQEHKLHMKLHKLILETCLWRFFYKNSS